MTALRVLVADDHAPTREDLVAALAADARLAVCATAADAPGAVDAALRERPDVCLLDVRMPGSGTAAAWEIAARLPRTRIVMLTVSRDDADLFGALHAGAHGYLLKDVDLDGLGDALVAVAAGDAMVTGQLLARLLETLRDRAPRRRATAALEHGAHLTSREWEILEQLCHERSTSDIARMLFVSEATVRTHIASAVHKLGAPDRESAVRLFAREWAHARTGPPREPPASGV